MNERFFALAAEKQHRIIDAGLHVFSKCAYRKASTDDIIKEAGISKGLLFHYFGNKKSFYLYLYEYAMDYLTTRMKSLYEGDNDFFGVIEDAQAMKLAALRDHPDLMNFIAQAYLSESPEVSPAINENFSLLVRQSADRFLAFSDPDKFKEGVDAEQALNIIIWMSEGFMRSLSPGELEDLEGANERFMEHLEVLRRQFYREEYV